MQKLDLLQTAYNMQTVVCGCEQGGSANKMQIAPVRRNRAFLLGISGHSFAGWPHGSGLACGYTNKYRLV